MNLLIYTAFAATSAIRLDDDDEPEDEDDDDFDEDKDDEDDDEDEDEDEEEEETWQVGGSEKSAKCGFPLDFENRTA